MAFGYSNYVIRDHNENMFDEMLDGMLPDNTTPSSPKTAAVAYADITDTVDPDHLHANFEKRVASSEWNNFVFDKPEYLIIEASSHVIVWDIAEEGVANINISRFKTITDGPPTSQWPKPIYEIMEWKSQRKTLIPLWSGHQIDDHIEEKSDCAPSYGQGLLLNSERGGSIQIKANNTTLDNYYFKIIRKQLTTEDTQSILGYSGIPTPPFFHNKDIEDTIIIQDPWNFTFSGTFNSFHHDSFETHPVCHGFTEFSQWHMYTLYHLAGVFSDTFLAQV